MVVVPAAATSDEYERERKSTRYSPCFHRSA